jgi:hypothetical protein
MAKRPPRQWLLIGVVCGLAAVVVVRFALVLLVGSFKALAVIGGVALLWIFLRGPRDAEH